MLEFATCRRILIRRYVSEKTKSWVGLLCDVGGSRTGRTIFPPSSSNYSCSRIIVNISENDEPDVIGDANYLPFRDNSFDYVTCTETLEHISHPELTIQEIYRVLKPGGVFLLTMPFMYPYHPHPADYQRWTSQKMDLVLRSLRFTEIEISPLGSTRDVVFDILYIALYELRPRLGRYLFSLMLRALMLIRFIVKFFPTLYRNDVNRTFPINTGYGVVCKKGTFELS